jgi:hypothetical protein
VASAGSAGRHAGDARLIIPALQVNMRAGVLPTDADGRPVLKVPLNEL